MKQEVEGGCLCAAVRYRVLGQPLYSAICHCSTCRRAAASAAVAWLTFERDRFRLLSGTPRVFQSSPGVLRSFCEHCGSPLTYRSDLRPSEIDVTAVSLDDPTLFPPTREVWLQHRLAWQPLSVQLEHFLNGGD